MLDRDAIFTLMKESNQQPHYQKKSSTLIETRSAGIFYILEYKGTGRFGWTVSDSALQEIKSYPKHSVLFINSTEGEMYIVLESNTSFFEALDSQESPYKIDKNDVEEFKINYENLEEYLLSVWNY